MKKYFHLYILLMISSVALSQNKMPVSALQNGDLLLISASPYNLSGAINRVTQHVAKQSYDHIALLERTKNDQLFVLEASPRKGSVRELLNTFLLDEKKSHRSISIYRLQSKYQETIPRAIAVAKTLLGKPYNESYILNDNSYYCSDFIERAFRSDSIFHLEPMTFINPTTKKIDSYWIEFYKKQNIDVPQGKLGCNPNGLAASPKLVLVGLLQ